MARPRSDVPSYRLHRQSGQAVVTLTDPSGRRKDFLLGPHKSKESRQEYHRLVNEWETAGRRLQADSLGTGLSVNELILAFWKFADCTTGSRTVRLPANSKTSN